MSLNFAATVPHPPIIIPEIGKDNLVVAEKTVSAMEKLATKFKQAEVDSVVLISPHAQSLSFAMTIFAPEKFSGNFADFAVPKIKMEIDCQTELAEKIYQHCQGKVPTEIERGDSFIDHGAMVPLFWLTEDLKSRIKLVEIAFSALPRIEHLEFGRIIGETIEKDSGRIAIIASGDLSHRIFDNGYKEAGQEFDSQIAKLIKNGKIAEIADMDEDLVETAGECGYRSLLILAGALNNKKYKSELLSYEAPFGVGYLVANFEL